MEQKDTQRIISLEAQNVLRLNAVKITPHGDMIVIGGANGEGKSSTLDCIEMAFGGKRHIPDVPVHRGAESGYIIIETDKFTVRRRFKAGGDSDIEVKTKEGYTVGTPQKLLDTLVGDLSFDPLAFVRMDAKKQAEVLMNLLGLDFSALDQEYKDVAEKRRDLGRDGDRLKGQLAGIPEDPTAPTEEVVVHDLMVELNNARDTNDQNADAHENLQTAEESLASAKKRVADLEVELSAARLAVTVCETALHDAQEATADLVDIDTAPIEEKIRNADTVNAKVRAQRERKALAAKLDEAAGAYKGYTDRLRAIDAEKADKIAAAEFPVPGVSFGPDGVLVNNLPFAQASSAEQLQIAVAIGLSANPALPVILIRDGSLLDDKSLAAVAAMAEQYKAQVWVERVGDGKEVSVVIQDGRVLEDRMAGDGD